MSIESDAAASSVLVVAPRAALGVALAVFVMELSLAVLAPWLLLRLRTTAAQRRELATLSASIASLRRASNQLNSPATFAEYAKVQRTLNYQIKRQQQLQAEVAAGTAMGPAAAPIMAAQQFALSYGIKMLVYAVCFLSCVGSTLFIVPVSGWLAPLAYTPLRVSLNAHCGFSLQLRLLDVNSACPSGCQSNHDLAPCVCVCMLFLVQFLLGEVGIVPWLAICSFVSTSVKAWL